MARDVLDTVVAAETPEGILLELRPAGLSVRFYAFLLDWLIRLVIAYAVGIAALATGAFGAAFWFVFFFLLEWFYPVVFELPAIFYLGFWFLIQIWSGFASLAATAAGAGDVGGVAWWAHVGGFVAGMALLGVFKRRVPPPRAPARHFVYGHPSPRRYYRF